MFKSVQGLPKKIWDGGVFVFNYGWKSSKPYPLTGKSLVHLYSFFLHPYKRSEMTILYFSSIFFPLNTHFPPLTYNNLHLQNHRRNSFSFLVPTSSQLHLSVTVTTLLTSSITPTSILHLYRLRTINCFLDYKF